MGTTTTEKWMEGLRKNRRELYARQDKIVENAMTAAERVIQNSSEEDKWLLMDDLTQKLISKIRRMRSKPPVRKRKDIFAETNIPTKLVNIDITGKQGILAGDLRIKGKIVQTDGNYAIVRVSKSNIMGWGG